MIGEQARIRNAVRRIDAAEKLLVDHALKPDDWTKPQWDRLLRMTRNERTDAIEALIQACRDYLRRR
jgi:hypothetical protein